MNAQSFGKYQLIKRLATGGMAEVWLARHTGIEGFQRELVVKRILPHLADDPEFVQMFLNEAKIAARFNHPNIAQIYDLGEANGTYFIAMEYVHGDDLGRVMRKAWSSGQWIARPLTIRMIASVCEGLYYAHSRADELGRPLKVVHRDISPQNILISFDGSVKVVDFGIAKAADQASLTKSGAIKGKFAYMAPEQAAGKVLDHRSDIFALGLVLYELLTGVRPLKRDSELATLQAALECAIQPPSVVADVPSELDPVVMRALAKAPDDRYRDARQLQVALEELLVSQRWVASSVQISELMSTLFADRLREESKLGRPNPLSEDSASAAPISLPEPSLSGRSEPRTGEASSPSMAWEAPPGSLGKQDRTRAASTSRRGAREVKGSGSRSFEAPADVPAWEAPPATEIPGRRRSNGEMPRRTTRDVSVRSSTRPPGEISRRATIRSMVAAEDEPADLSRPPLRSGPLALDARPPEPEEDDDERTLAADAPEGRPPPRPRRVTPSAPPRRSSSQTEIAAAEPDAPEDHSRAPAPLGLSPRASPQRIVQAVLGLTLVALIVTFRAPLWRLLNSSAKDSQPVPLSVTSNPDLRIEVSVQHSDGCGSSEPITPLGFAPFSAKDGAHVQDVLILDNPRLGAHFEHRIPYRPQGEVEKVHHTFKLGKVRLRITPPGITHLSVARGGYPLGPYTPLVPLELAEGKHTLELSGDMLRESVSVDVAVRAGQLQETSVDLRSVIQ